MWSHHEMTCMHFVSHCSWWRFYM